MIVTVHDCADPRLDCYSKLSDAQLMEYPVGTPGMFIAESRLVIERALKAGMQPVSLFVEDRWFEQSADLIEQFESRDQTIPILRVTRAQMQEITGYQITRGALAAFARPPLPSLESLLCGAHRIAILEGISNYTNIGALFRSAAALGIDAVLVTAGCHDPLYKRAARVSMGTVFQVPWGRIASVADVKPLGFKVAALALDKTALSLEDPQLKAESKLALVFGSEGAGLKPETKALCDYTVIIPMEHEVDSLNVAAAAAVAFWELRYRS